LATNRQANSLKDKRQGKLISLAVLALKDDFLGDWLPRKLQPDLIYRRAKEMLQPPRKEVFLTVDSRQVN
jgi:hypothetical protein